MKQPKFSPYYTTQVAGRPPTLRELDGKLISLLHSIRSRGGVLNFSVVKASALSLVIVIHLQIFQDLRLRHPGLGLFISGAISHAEQEPPPARQYHVGFMKNASLLISQISTGPSHNITFPLNW